MPRPRLEPATSAARAPAKHGKRDGKSVESIHAELYGAIIGHRIPPGTALQEDALASAFGVSRTIVRAALQRLSHARLVDLVPNKGAAVAKPSADEAREVFEARLALERVLVERVAQSATGAGIAKLIQLVKREKLAFETGDKAGRVKLSGDFHRQLAELAGNTVLSAFLNELVSRTSLIIALYESPGAVPCSHGEHLEIAQALKRRDGKKAAQYMDHHLRHIEAQIELVDSHKPVDFKSLFKPSV